jgi:hypothetical protein
MARTLILADVHCRWKKNQQIIENETFDKIIFGGDFFDQFHDTPFDNAQTARWLKRTIEKYKVEICMSNHDIAYRYPNNRDLVCSGFSEEKSKAINEVLTREDWDLFVPYIVEQDFLISHAGVSSWLYQYICSVHSVEKTNSLEAVEATLAHEIAEAEYMCEHGTSHAFYWVSSFRGGMSRIPGLNWCDFREFIPIKNVNQIFFHTPVRAPALKTMAESGAIGVWFANNEFSNNDLVSYNYDLDTHSSHYAILEDKTLSIFATPNKKDEPFEKELIYTRKH